MIIRAVFLGVRFGLGFKLLKCNKMYFPGGGLEKFPLWFKDKITTTYGIRLDCGNDKDFKTIEKHFTLISL